MSGDNSISFFCSHCSQSLEAESAMAGRETKCPVCQKSIAIPVPQPSIPQLSLRNFLSNSREAKAVDPKRRDEKVTLSSPKPAVPVAESVEKITSGPFIQRVKENRHPLESANSAHLHDAYGRKKINSELPIKPAPDLHRTVEPDTSSTPITLLIPHNKSTLSSPVNAPLQSEAISCNHCGAQHHPGTVICDLCGQSINAGRQPQTVKPKDQHHPLSLNRRCPDCGKSVTPEDVICIDCGLNLKTGKKTATHYEDEVDEPPASYVKYQETKANPPADYNVSSGLGPFGYIATGIILTVLGFGLTRHSYDAVASSGGQYTIYTGLMIIGIYNIFKGFFRWFGD